MTRHLPLIPILLLVLLGAPAGAHEVRPAYLEIRETEPNTYDVLWKVPARGDLRLGIYVAMPPDAERLTEPRAIFDEGAYVERWTVRCPEGLAGRTIRIDGLSATKIDVLARVAHADGVTQTARLDPSSPSFTVQAVPSSWKVVTTYTAVGVEHILLGVDHLLFVLGLVLLVDRRWMLLKTVTAFTLAHSITLALSTFAVIRVPEAPLNASIALSILFLAPEIERKRRGETSLTIRQPWVVAFAFGLIHGVGFASGLSLLGLPRAEIPSALLCFNLGVEAGQLAFVGVILVTGLAARTLDLTRPAVMLRASAYLVGTLGAYWTIQRAIMIF